VIGLAALRSAAGVETIDELDAAGKELLVTVGTFLRHYDAALDKLTATEQMNHGVALLCKDASEVLCKDLKVPELTAEQAGSRDAAMQRYAASCLAKLRFDVLLFVPTNEA
jgi:hypothetical protein